MIYLQGPFSVIISSSQDLDFENHTKITKYSMYVKNLVCDFLEICGKVLKSFCFFKTCCRPSQSILSLKVVLKIWPCNTYLA